MDITNVRTTDMLLAPADAWGEDNTKTQAVAHVTKHNTVTNRITENMHSTSIHKASWQTGSMVRT